MRVSLSDTARQYLVLFEDVTGATAVDCVLDEDHEQVLFVVAAGEMGQAIGPDGKRVKRLEARLGEDVELIEDAPTPEGFVANALAPAAVYNVTISENDDRVAYAEVDHEDHGIAIGEKGRNIEAAKRLAKRHFDVDDIQLT
ncbi:transcription elongation factor NusA [Halodesulfurarchaeum formicicum]|uniref:Probable transcription termination protein NusA n=1 Tax=Halodesulfurarchaeum formicicum TaxID=1873524 RepID=A0A1D8S5T6_9EURY|nr:NusA-like transcription termination signal-binding factor [Halodesulfurarchaeum formicicum]AOW80705.1 transcription elongation factor NusA [Halodesulfurarchaeum formicicum]APE96043.1 N utilization substance protein A [Halodesulfurarchaeum formicicum]